MLNQVLDNLFIGDWQDVTQLDPKEFVRVTVAYDSPFVGEYFFSLIDGRREENKYEYDAAVEKVLELLQGPKKVAVHCIAGQSRSAAVVLGVLRYLGWSLIDAYFHLLKCRPSIDPRLSLFEHLLKDWPEFR